MILVVDSVSGVGVIDKGVVILRALARGPLDLAALQAETDLPRATAHRLAVALELHGLVRRDPQGRFCLGFELIRLGRAAEDQFPLAELTRPILTGLRDTTGESVQLYVADVTVAGACSRSSRRTGCAGSFRRVRCCRSTAALRAGCCRVTTSPRVSRSASRALRRSAQLCATAGDRS